MIGALQVVLEGMHRRCYFYLNARPSAPASSPDTTALERVRHFHTCILAGLIKFLEGLCWEYAQLPSQHPAWPTGQPCGGRENGAAAHSQDAAPELQFWRCG